MYSWQKQIWAQEILLHTAFPKADTSPAVHMYKLWTLESILLRENLFHLQKVWFFYWHPAYDRKIDFKYIWQGNKTEKLCPEHLPLHSTLSLTRLSAPASSVSNSAAHGIMPRPLTCSGSTDRNALCSPRGIHQPGLSRHIHCSIYFGSSQTFVTSSCFLTVFQTGEFAKELSYQLRCRSICVA